MEQGVLPTSISSDLHIYNVDGPVYDLASVVTKFLHLGMSLDDALSRVTNVPADIIHMPGQIGTLAPGSWGDAVVFELRTGTYQLDDSSGESRTGSHRLVPLMVIKSGSVYRNHNQAIDDRN